MSNSQSLIPASPVLPVVASAHMAPCAGQRRVSQGQVFPAAPVQQNTKLQVRIATLKLTLAQARIRNGSLRSGPAVPADKGTQTAPLVPPFQQTGPAVHHSAPDPSASVRCGHLC